MTEMSDDEPVASEAGRGLVTLCVLAAVAGVAIGVVGGAFRWGLHHLDRWRVDMLDATSTLPGPGWLIPIAVTAAGASLGAFIAQLVPLASGSGIQHVEAVERGQAGPPPLRVVPAKFVGGLIAIGSGLILGREGPTVHMGAAIGAEFGRRARLPDTDIRLLHTSLSGAGLGVAFNAPIGGGLFALEEVAKAFRFRLVLPTLVAVSVAVACSRLIIGNDPDFRVAAVETPSMVVLPTFVVFGLLTGVVGVLYNRVILGTLALVRHLTQLPAIVKAGVIGAAIGALLAVDPLTAGGGDALSQQIFDGGGLVLPVVAGLLLVRFLAGPLSYAAGTPGGLFAPLLAVGALWGVLFAAFADLLLPDDQPSLRIAMVIVGMSALFGACVRAPVTGVVLVLEMVAITSVTIPMVLGTACAVLVAHLLGAPPIYDSLREQMLADAQAPKPPGAQRRED